MNRAISWLRMTWQVLSNPKRRTGEGGRYTLFREPSADSPRDLVVHGHWMAGIVLSEGFATRRLPQLLRAALRHCGDVLREHGVALTLIRSEEHTSELQSRLHLVCRLLLEKKK